MIRKNSWNISRDDRSSEQLEKTSSKGSRWGGWNIWPKGAGEKDIGSWGCE